MQEAKFLALYEMVVAQTIAKLREERGLTQSEMAERVGLSRSTWSRIEKGESGLSLDNLKQVAEVLGKQPHELLAIVDQLIDETPALRLAAKKDDILAATAALSAGQVLGAAFVPATGAIVGALISSALSALEVGVRGVASKKPKKAP
ncbi:helix-turn-helix domain-containing protein [Pseudomonas knackmussii]|uniref:helix-turn-helix domain-containing protein n=1 Tax=Pseudomonas knackmussii TaxID=65741 RepID=UPI003F49EADD